MIDNIKRYNYKNKDDSGQCWLKFAQWYQRRFSKRFMMDKNRCQVMVKAHMPFGLSKLKKKKESTSNTKCYEQNSKTDFTRS